MGSFYVNFVAKSKDTLTIASVLREADRTAIVTAVPDADVVVFDEAADTQDMDVILEVGVLLSSNLAAPVFAVLNHDDDVLCYWLFSEGKLIDAYNSEPTYFDEDADEAQGGDPALLARTLDAADAESRLQDILYHDEFTFAMEQHAALVEALHLPEWSIGCGFTYIDNGELPEGLREESLIRTP